MHKEILIVKISSIYQRSFDSYKCRFPQNEKEPIVSRSAKLNDAMAEKYNKEGSFPCTLLLDSNGKVIYTWKGFYNKGLNRLPSR